MRKNPATEAIEADLLFQAVARVRGVELPRGVGEIGRLRQLVRKEKVRSISGLQEKILHRPEALERLVQVLLPPAVPYSAGFLQKFRREIVPVLRTYPSIRIWQIGCGAVFETYCLAIILMEEGVYEKSTIYGTDLNETSLEACQNGLFPLDDLETKERVYERSGGRRGLSDYFLGGGSQAVFDPALRRNMVFARHNLATDGSFNECHAVFCRSSLEAFGRSKQDRVQVLLYDSLVVFGVLGLTLGESLHSAAVGVCFEPLDPRYNLYRKTG